MQITYDIPNFSQGYYQDRRPVRKCARGWAMLQSGGSTKAVILYHGYAGYPGELIRPGIDLYATGWDVWCPRLPGHGTSGRDFSRTGKDDWLGTAFAAYEYLHERYEEVAVVGHSMGGAIATIVAGRYNAKRLVLLAPALLIPSIPVDQVRRWRHFIRRKKVAWQADPAYQFHYEGDPDDDSYLGRQYWSYVYLRQVRQLELLRREAVGAVEALVADTLAISGAKDPVIGEAASLLVTSKPLGTNLHRSIKGGGHYLPYDKDRAAQDEAMKAVVAWLEER